MKRNIRRLPSEKMKHVSKQFYDAITGAKNSRDIEVFFRGFLGEYEKAMLERRFCIATMLADGATYLQIQDELGVGPDTIRQVRYWITGKQRTLRAPKKGYSRSSLSRNSDNPDGSFQNFLDKYPGRNAILNTIFGRRKK